MQGPDFQLQREGVNEAGGKWKFFENSLLKILATDEKNRFLTRKS